MDENLVSIVLPSYNGGRFIRQAIDSVLNQTYENLELILIDDCSSDDTGLIMQEYATQSSKVKYYRHTTNKKLPAALNTGFSMSRGDYLTWTSDDNLYRPNAIYSMVRFLKNHPSVHLVYTDYTTIDNTGNKIKDIRVSDPSGLWREPVVKCCFLYRREIYNVIGGYAERWRYVEDYEYWLRVNSKFNISPLHETLYLYRKHSSSLSSLNHYSVLMKKEELQFVYLDTLKLSKGEKNQLYKKFITSAYRRRQLLLVSKRCLKYLYAYPYDALIWALQVFNKKARAVLCQIK